MVTTGALLTVKGVKWGGSRKRPRHPVKRLEAQRMIAAWRKVRRDARA